MLGGWDGAWVVKIEELLKAKREEILRVAGLLRGQVLQSNTTTSRSPSNVVGGGA